MLIIFVPTSTVFSIDVASLRMCGGCTRCLCGASCYEKNGDLPKAVIAGGAVYEGSISAVGDGGGRRQASWKLLGHCTQVCLGVFLMYALILNCVSGLLPAHHTLSLPPMLES